MDTLSPACEREREFAQSGCCDYSLWLQAHLHLPHTSGFKQINCLAETPHFASGHDSSELDVQPNDRRMKIGAKVMYTFPCPGVAVIICDYDEEVSQAKPLSPVHVCNEALDVIGHLT